MASNGMMSQAEIEALMASMNDGQTGTPDAQPAEPAAMSSQAVSADTLEVQSEVASKAQKVDGPMSQEEVEAFLASINAPKQDADAFSSNGEVTKAAEPEVEAPVAEPADPNRAMTPEEIEAMLGAMNAGEAAPKEPEVEVAAKEPEVEAASEPADPNRAMTPEEIEAMLGAMNTGEAAPKEPEVEAAAEPADPNRAMTPEEIEAMLGAMNTGEAAPKEPEVEAAAEPADPNRAMTPEEIEAMLGAMNAGEAAPKEPEVKAAAEPADPNKTMSPEEIETILPVMNGGEEVQAEAPEVKAAVEAVPSENPQVNESEAAPKAVQEQKQSQSVDKPSTFTVIKEKIAVVFKGKANAKGSVKSGKSIASKRNIIAAVCILLSLAGGIGLYYVGAFPQITFISKGSSVNATVQNKLAKMGITFTTDEFVKYAGRGNKEVIELFLMGNMEIDSYRVSDGVTPLMAASSFGQVDMVDLLLEKGANINAKDKDDQTALMKAVKYNHAEVVEHLLKGGADVRGRDLHGNTVVSFALDKKDRQIMTMLSKAGARGLEEGLAQIRAAVKTKNSKGKNGEAIDDELAASIAPEFLIKSGRAGYALIGRPVETLYANYPEGNIIFSTGYTDGRSYPLIKIMVPGQSSPSLLLSLNISKRGQQQLIDSIEVRDERFKTQEGISISSTVGEIKRTAAGMGYVKQMGEVLYLVSKDNHTMFELEIEAGTLPTNWLKSGDVSSLPDDMKIRSIVLL